MRAGMLRVTAAMLLAFGVSVAGAATQTTQTTQTTHKASTAHKATVSQVRTYTGTVKVTKDKAGQVSAVQLSTGKIVPRTYAIVLDKEGKDLAANMDAKRVQVKGTLEKQSGKNVLVVKEFSLVPTKPAATKAPKATTTKTSKPVKTKAPKTETPM